MGDQEALQPGAIRPRLPEDFDKSYSARPAWDIGRPQPAFLQLAGQGAFRGRVLDVGCGTGEHALMVSEMGLEVTGIDLAATAIAAAQVKAKARNLAANFLVLNALELASLDGPFDTALDCGLFHVLEDADRRPFVDSLRIALRPGGTYFMLCFSDRQPGHWGPRRISAGEIRSHFEDGWEIESIEPSKFEIWIAPEGAVAWLARITRT